MHPTLLAAMELHGGVFAAADAVAAGVARTAIPHLVSTGAWRRVRYGVYTTTDLWRHHVDTGTTHELECAAVVRRLGRRSVVSHTSAARLHGLVVPPSASTDVWLTDPDQYRRGKGYRVMEAPLPEDTVQEHGAFSTTTIPRTLADVGRQWDVVDTVVAADDALADGRTTPAELTAAALAQTHWVACGQSASALGLAAVGAHSPHETRTRLQLVGAGLPAPLLQVAVWLGNRLVAVLDMFWPDQRVFLNCDGKIKVLDPWNGRTPAEAVWRAKVQHDTLVDLGLRGVHVTPADLRAPWPAKVSTVRRLLEGVRPELLPGVRFEQWRGGLRSAPAPTSRAA